MSLHAAKESLHAAEESLHAAEDIIEIASVSKRYGAIGALRDVSLSIPAGVLPTHCPVDS